MKKRMLEGVFAAVGIVALASAGPASAQDARFPTRDASYKVWMARAMDQCTPGGTSVVGTIDDPSAGCLQANVVTDEPFPNDSLGATMNYAFLSVRATASPNFKGRVHLFGAGFQPFQRVKVRLTLRTTRSLLHTKHPPGSNKRVTFADTTIECGVGAGNCWPARPNGSIAGNETLNDCLVANGEPRNLRLGNIQILDSALVNCDTGKIIGTPGIKQVPRGVR